MIQVLSLVLALAATSLFGFAGDEWYRAPGPGTQTRWISPENPSGAKGTGGQVNRGAKGAAFIVIKPGETAVIADITGAGIIHRIWMSGTIPRNAEQRRLVRIQAFWDDAGKPAVDCPAGDFFGTGLGLAVPLENALFSNPEGRSFNANVPMPFRRGAKIQLVNESPSYALVWYDINYSAVDGLDEDVLYFHAAWRREQRTELGRDFEILPHVVGKGRYLGTNIGVIGGEDYRGTWFGEGEVKLYLDGDRENPTLVGTGTEDYIGSGWGQGVFHGRYSGSLVSDNRNDIYAFYRYHIDDPVFFHQDCRVTIQQMGNTTREHVLEMLARGVDLQPLLTLDLHGENVLDIRQQEPSIYLLLDRKDLPPFDDPRHPTGGTNFYRRDDVSATVYFYLDRPENDLPPLAPAKDRIAGLPEKVWSKVKE